MSRRLSAPLTDEDFWIWQRFHARGWVDRHLVKIACRMGRRDVFGWHSHERWWLTYRTGDRRDADLMLGFIRLPQLVPELRGFRPLARMAFHVEFGAERLK